MTKHEDSFTADLMQELARLVEDRLSTICPPLAFCILVFPYDAPGIGNYVSNADREGMIESLRETADRLERNQDKPR